MSELEDHAAYERGYEHGREAAADRIAELEAALAHYALQYCEHNRDYEGCGKLSMDECGGCVARKALATS